MDFKQFTDKTLKDIEIKATELFDRNFEQQAFFFNKWQKRKNDSDSGRGILMGRGSGRLRKGIKATQINGNTITWSFDVPYAKIHNEGGTIKTTQNVRPFSRTVKGKEQKVKGFSRKVNIKMPQRQFIGDHPIVRQRTEDIIGANFNELQTYFYNKLKK